MKRLVIGIMLLSASAMLFGACSSSSSGNDSNSDTSGPIITSVTPTADAKAVSSNGVISAIFSKAMTTSSISGATFQLSTATTSAVPGTVMYDVVTQKAVFSPTASAKLDPATTYTATITTGVKDSVGAALASNFVWSFKTTHLDEYGFGTNGKVTTNVGGSDAQTEDIAYAIVVQADGKIVVAGDATDILAGDTPRYALVRYTTNGFRDTTFNAAGPTPGIIRAPHVGSNTWDQVRALAIDASNMIVVAGWSDENTLVARYTANGTPDGTFGISGTGTVVQDLSGTSHDDSAYAIAIEPGGNIIIGGTSICGPSYAHSCMSLARYNGNGSIDTTFGASGITKTDLDPTATGIRSIALDTNGKIVVGATTGADLVGTTTAHIVVARYLNTGVLDTSFNATGYVVTSLSPYGDSAQAIAIQPADNKILVAGWTAHDAVVLRYNTDGQLDMTFGNQGRAVTDIGVGNNYAYALALQSDGKIVLAGTAPNPADSGDEVFALMRYTSGGILDAAFENNGIALLNFTSSDKVDAAHVVAIDSTTGKIVVAGEAGGDFGIARYVQ